MGELQSTGTGLTGGGAGAYDQSLSMPAALVPAPYVVSCIPIGPGDAPANDRYGFWPIVGPAARFFAPAKAGGLPFYYFGRFWHSVLSPYFWPNVVNGDRWFFAGGTLAPGEELFMLHGLKDPQGEDVAPDMVAAAPVQLPAAGQNWGITKLDDTEIAIKNYDGVNTLDYNIRCWLVHSIQGNNPDGRNQLLSGLDVVLPTGGGIVNVPHGLVEAPDLITVAPFDDGGAGNPDGMIVLAGPQTDTEIPLANADPAAADLPIKVWAQRTHSIQL